MSGTAGLALFTNDVVERTAELRKEIVIFQIDRVKAESCA
jgi:hypothetical protein